MAGIFINRVFDSVADNFVFWRTESDPDAAGAAYPGPGVFGTDTTDYVVSFKETSGSSGFTLTRITSKAVIPADQTMLYHGDIFVDDGGDLLIEGDATPVRTEDNYSANIIPVGGKRVVQGNDQMLYTSSLVIKGNLDNRGSILDVTPYDGFDILNALTDIAPSAPAVLGVSSPAHFMEGPEFRAAMDVPSNADLASLNVPFSSEIYAASFSPTLGVTNRWDSSVSGIVALLPISPADSSIVSFVNVNSGFPLLVDGNGNLTPTGPTLSIPGGSPSIVVSLKFSVDDGMWYCTENLALLAFGIVPNSLIVANSTPVPTLVTIAEGQFFGYSIGGSIGAMSQGDALAILFPAGETALNNGQLTFFRTVNDNVNAAGTGGASPTYLNTYLSCITSIIAGVDEDVALPSAVQGAEMVIYNGVPLLTLYVWPVNGNLSTEGLNTSIPVPVLPFTSVRFTGLTTGSSWVLTG